MYIRNAISNRGVKAYNAKDYKTALTAFNELLVLNPNDTAMYMNAGVVAKMDENYPEAIKHFKKMTEFNGPDAKNYHIELINISLNNLKII
ncbi:MAG: tetratricopeptide repeat protein [Pedobacter sp.]|nr:MAG: tetratricopeptide repeat protein [Pedobacter sp.]